MILFVLQNLFRLHVLIFCAQLYFNKSHFNDTPFSIFQCWVYTCHLFFYLILQVISQVRNSQQNFSGEIFFFHGSRAVRKMEPQVSPVACLLPMRDTLAVAPWTSFFLKACLKTTLCWVVATQIFFMFIPTWWRFPIWLIFFKWVETTNQFGISDFIISWLLQFPLCGYPADCHEKLISVDGSEIWWESYIIVHPVIYKGLHIPGNAQDFWTINWYLYVILSLKLTNRPWKWMVGRWSIFFWDDLFSEGILIMGI